MPPSSINRRQFLGRTGAVPLISALASCRSSRPPNFVFIHTDDQRHDALGCSGNGMIRTPSLDNLAARGVRFTNAFVATSICSPSRACCFTGRYASLNGVMNVPGNPLNDGEVTFVQLLKERGYQAGYSGKWHLNGPVSPAEAGYDFASYFHSNGPQWDRKVFVQDTETVADGFIEDYISARAIDFLESAAARSQPFLLHYSTQVPHMDHEFNWVPKPATLDSYYGVIPEVPESWSDGLSGKPEYLKTSRSRAQALKYGYHNRSRVQAHIREYYAAITDMDAALGRTLDKLDELGVRDNTYIIFMGDNGWMIGEHGFTSKVLPYEESIRVPMIVAGPGISPGVRDELVLNADIMPSILDFAGIPPRTNVNGRALGPLLSGQTSAWRDTILYESPSGALGTHPLVAVRGRRWKYIQTFHRDRPSELMFEELYDLETDAAEMQNLAGQPAHAATQKQLAAELHRLRNTMASAQTI